MYILTSKYFPTDSWPDLYFPALPEGADIQYTEIMEFDVELITSALFDVVMPVNALFTLEMPTVITMEVYEELSL